MIEYTLGNMQKVAYEKAARYFQKQYPKEFVVYYIAKNIKVKLSRVELEKELYWFVFKTKNGKEVAHCIKFSEVM